MSGPARERLLPPAPRAFAVLRLPSARRDPVGFLRSLGAESHDAVSFRFGRRRVVVVNDPALTRDVMVTHNEAFSKAFLRGATREIMGESIFATDGPPHDRQRVAMLKAVRHDQFEPLPGRTFHAAAALCGGWPAEGSIDAAAEMRRLSMQLTLVNIFGESDPAARTAVLEALEGTIASYDRAVSPAKPLLDLLPLASTRRIKEGTRNLRSWVEARVDERQQAGNARTDVLSALIAHRYTDGGADRLGRKELMDECVDLIIGAHETVAAGLAWTLYLLAAHPNMQERIREEVAHALGGRAPTLTDLAALSYTRRVVRESFRRYPPSWGFLRLAKKEVQVGRYTIPAGSVVVMSPALTHNDARYFPHPERFDPDRWLHERQGEMVKEAYFPFGVGPRSCIGEPIALAELATSLAAIVPRVALGPPEVANAKARPRMALEPAGPLMIRVKRLDALHPPQAK